MSETRCAGTFLGLLLAVALLGSTNLSAQVHRSATGIGDALILPYWTAAGGNDSLLSIRNDSERASAIKLLWLDEHGEVGRSVNLYLNGQSLWVGAVTGSGRVVHVDQSHACMLPLELNADPEVGYTDFLVNASRGSLEIIEMASVAMDSPLAPEGQWIDCNALAERWDDGPWAADAAAGLLPPAGMLSASNNLINVELGGMNTLEATALGGFSDQVQHASHEDPRPDLSSAVDSGAQNGGVRSFLCAGASCRVDEWTAPIEAIAAVLMASRVKTDYSAEGGLGARFEWLLHRPLDRYKSTHPDLEFTTSPTLSFFSRSGVKHVLCGPGECTVVIPEGPFPERNVSEFDIDLWPTLDVVALSMSSSDSPPLSPILGHPIETITPSPSDDAFRYDAGQLRLTLTDQERSLTAADGSRFPGEPVLAIGVQQFTNGVLPGGTLANYRGTETPRYEVTIIEPQE